MCGDIYGTGQLPLEVIDAIESFMETEEGLHEAAITYRMMRLDSWDFRYWPQKAWERAFQAWLELVVRYPFPYKENGAFVLDENFIVRFRVQYKRTLRRRIGDILSYTTTSSSTLHMYQINSTINVYQEYRP